MKNKETITLANWAGNLKEYSIDKKTPTEIMLEEMQKDKRFYDTLVYGLTAFMVGLVVAVWAVERGLI